MRRTKSHLVRSSEGISPSMLIFEPPLHIPIRDRTLPYYTLEDMFMMRVGRVSFQLVRKVRKDDSLCNS